MGIFAGAAHGRENAWACAGSRHLARPCPCFCKGCGQAPARPGGNPCCGKHHADKPESDVVLKKVSLAIRKK